jgi:hypothetical protein
MSNSTSECNSYATAAVPRCTDSIILAALAGLGPEGELISWWEAAGAPARAIIRSISTSALALFEYADGDCSLRFVSAIDY